ncbi:MAG: hypothetical protein AABY22_26255 [Nanoarchaeota archaeon]
MNELVLIGYSFLSLFFLFIIVAIFRKQLKIFNSLRMGEELPTVQLKTLSMISSHTENMTKILTDILNEIRKLTTKNSPVEETKLLDRDVKVETGEKIISEKEKPLWDI